MAVTKETQFFSLFSVSNNAWLNNFAKRLFDIVLSALGLVILLPLLSLIALAIKRDSAGPVIYRGRRIGQKGKVFEILKFRTMYEDPKSYSGPKVTAHDDARITPLGHWLRNTKLNELPQLWNVLIGDMSLVGPRPEDPDIASSWPKDVWNEVLSVKPGVTSPASVQYRNEESLLSSSNVITTYMEELSPEKTRMDQLYVRNRSLLLDLDTLLWTFLLLLPKIGAQTPPEELLFVGPFTRLVSRYINWFVIDLVVTFGAISVSGLFTRLFGPLDIGWPRSIAAGICFSLLFSLTGGLLGVNRIKWSKAAFQDIFDLLPAWGLASVIAILANRILKIFPTEMVMVASALSIFGYVVVRYRSRLLNAFLTRVSRRRSINMSGRERVLIVGTGSTAQHAAWLLTHPAVALKYWIVGFVDNDMFKQGMRVYGVDVVGMNKDIPALVKKYDVGMIILADNESCSPGHRSIINICNQTKAKLVVLPNFISIFNELVSNLGNVPMIPVSSGGKASSRDENEMRCIECMTKRTAVSNGATEAKDESKSYES